MHGLQFDFTTLLSNLWTDGSDCRAGSEFGGFSAIITYMSREPVARVSDFDTPHQDSLELGHDLPFGRGKYGLGHDWNSAA